MAGKTFPAFPAHAQTEFDVSGKRPIARRPIYAAICHHQYLWISLHKGQVMQKTCLRNDTFTQYNESSLGSSPIEDLCLQLYVTVLSYVSRHGKSYSLRRSTIFAPTPVNLSDKIVPHLFCYVTYFVGFYLIEIQNVLPRQLVWIPHKFKLSWSSHDVVYIHS